MLTISNLPRSNSYQNYIKNNIQNDPKSISKDNCTKNCLNLLANYNKFVVSFQSLNSQIEKGLDINNIKNLRIGNLRFVENNGLRGETLSSKRHKRFIPILKEYGLKSVIDLRDKFTGENYEDLCKSAGLNYYHIPIDSFKLDTSKIIDKMPLLFKVMDNDNYYMACALGLHRTDIAQTINYLFNPKTHDIPIMYGHQRNGIFKRDDIMRRIGSIKREITPQQLRDLGWGSDFESVYQMRKQKYTDFNIAEAQKAMVNKSVL